MQKQPGNKAYNSCEGDEVQHHHPHTADHDQRILVGGREDDVNEGFTPTLSEASSLNGALGNIMVDDEDELYQQESLNVVPIRLSFEKHPLLIETVIQHLFDFTDNPFSILLVNRTWYLYFHHVYIQQKSRNKDENHPSFLERIGRSIARRDMKKLTNFVYSMHVMHSHLMRGITHVQIQENKSKKDEASSMDVCMTLSNGNIIKKDSSKSTWEEFTITQKKKTHESPKPISSSTQQEFFDQAEDSILGGSNVLSSGTKSYCTAVVSKKSNEANEKRFIVTGGNDCIIRVLDYETGELQASFSKANRQPILALSLSGDKIFSASDGVYVLQYNQVDEVKTEIPEHLNDKEDHEFEKRTKFQIPKTKLSKEEEKKREKELRKQYQKKQIKEKKDRGTLKKSRIVLLKSFKHQYAGLVTSMQIHKYDKSHLLLITSHTDNSIRLWDYHTETVLAVIIGDYCAPVFSAFLSFKGFGKQKYFSVCSINDSFENAYVWNPNTLLPSPTVQYNSNPNATIEDVLFRKRNYDISSQNILFPEKHCKEFAFFSLTTPFQTIFSIPFQIEEDMLSCLGRRTSEIGIFQPNVSLDIVNKRENPPIEKLKSQVHDSSSSYLLDEISQILEGVGTTSAKEIAATLKERIEKTLEEPLLTSTIAELIIWYACRSSNAHFSQVFSEICYRILFGLKTGPSKDSIYDVLKRALLSEKELLDLKTSSKLHPLFHTKLSHALLIANLFHMYPNYFRRVLREVILDVEKDLRSSWEAKNMAATSLNIMRMYILLIVPFTDKPVDISYVVLSVIDPEHLASISDIIKEITLNTNWDSSFYYVTIAKEMLSILESKHIYDWKCNLEQDFICKIYYTAASFRAYYTKQFVKNNIYNSRERIIYVETEAVPYLYGFGKRNIMKIQQQSRASVFIGKRPNDHDRRDKISTKKQHQEGDTFKKKQEKRHQKEEQCKKQLLGDYTSVSVRGEIRQVDLALALVDNLLINFYDKQQKFSRKFAPITSLFLLHDMINVEESFLLFTPYTRLPLGIKYINERRFALKPIGKEHEKVLTLSQALENPVLSSQNLKHISYGNGTISRKVYLNLQNDVTFCSEKYYSDKVFDNLSCILQSLRDYSQQRLKVKLTIGKLFFYQLPQHIESNNNCIPFCNFLYSFNQTIHNASEDIKALLLNPARHHSEKKVMDLKYSFDDNVSKHHQATITSKLAPSMAKKFESVMCIEIADKKNTQLLHLKFIVKSGDHVTVQFKSLKTIPATLCHYYYLNLTQKGSRQECDSLISFSPNGENVESQYYILIKFAQHLEEYSTSNIQTINQLLDYIKYQFLELEENDKPKYINLHDNYMLSNVTVAQIYTFECLYSKLDTDISSISMGIERNLNDSDIPLKIKLIYMQHHCSLHSTVTRYQWKMEIVKKHYASESAEKEVIPLLDASDILLY
ncbi:hypothetical protein C9374_011255 [Naegleria lovaniensis]|uniref:Uncharacterized protein n=1 Tax=Naegleria lovaniensis TaxID=51637 RepID=A0AA88KWG2_NAELO|nr:uncharacterized protein C9374_011255 [Naegleria lovaniensis]KAG2392530.1 hypothetical protein C9374_011255 [Naegleria lovaniensis]